MAGQYFTDRYFESLLLQEEPPEETEPQHQVNPGHFSLRSIQFLREPVDMSTETDDGQDSTVSSSAFSAYRPQRQQRQLTTPPSLLPSWQYVQKHQLQQHPQQHQIQQLPQLHQMRQQPKQHQMQQLIHPHLHRPHQRPKRHQRPAHKEAEMRRLFKIREGIHLLTDVCGISRDRHVSEAATLRDCRERILETQQLVAAQQEEVDLLKQQLANSAVSSGQAIEYVQTKWLESPKFELFYKLIGKTITDAFLSHAQRQSQQTSETFPGALARSSEAGRGCATMREIKLRPSV